MAAWCFVCDGPVTGDRCPTCGREPTLVQEPAEPERDRWAPLAAVPRAVWVVAAVVVVAILFWLLQSGFRFTS